MEDWIELLNKEVFTVVLSVHIKNKKIMVRVRDEINLSSFKSNEEAISKAEKIVAYFKTLTEESVYSDFFELFDIGE